jgi:hypothetical protein
MGGGTTVIEWLGTFTRRPPPYKNAGWHFVMKIWLSILIPALLSQFSLGQTKFLTSGSDTLFWKSRYVSLADEIGLEKAERVTAEFFFRFWDQQKVVELKRNNGQLSGNVTFLLRQYLKKKKGRVYSKKFQISDTNVERIYQLVLKYGILELPTDKRIKGWQEGFDGAVYVTEHIEHNNYSFKTYWTPSAQKSLSEAGRFLDFISELDRIDDIRKANQDFMSSQPFNSWYGGISEGTIVTRVTNAR